MDQFLNKHHSKFSQFMDLVYFLVVTNFLAILGTIAGLVLFGLFPSIMATYALVKMRIRGETFPIAQTFISQYKKTFVESNKIGLILIFLWASILISWFFYLEELTTTFHWIGLAAIGLFAIILFFLTMIMPITYVYFPKFKLKEYFTFSLMFSLGMPLLTLVIVLNLLFFYAIVVIRLVSIFPFLAFSLPAYVNVYLANRRIMKLFTVFQDEHVSIRTLNSFGFYDQLYQLFSGDEGEHPLIASHDFMRLIETNVIEGRLSLVMTDEKEKVIGMLLSSYHEEIIHLELMWIDASFQRRGYGSKMLAFIEKPLQHGDIQAVELGSDRGYFSSVPFNFAQGLQFFRKHGYTILRQETGWSVRKVGIQS
jgi:uncharacterized membrane protein YesL/GNAT superfamily N-acetyltransferase